MIINNGDKIDPNFIEVLTAYIELSNIMSGDLDKIWIENCKNEQT